jgi:N-acetylglucosaminyldiphosphoundecaprenol N-acetyl-beta-D-mannosaminyltransferase
MPFSTPAPLGDAAAPDVADPAVPPPTVDVLGVPLALTDYERTMDWMDATIAQRKKGYVCVAATHTVVATQDDPELRDAVRGASLVVPYGQPVVWAMNALGHDLTHRVYGPDLMAKTCERAAASGHRMFLYGGRNQGALVQLALNLRRRFPGLRIVGGYSPPFRALSAEEIDAVVEEINHARPDIVWVGIGVPKQEKWMAHMRPRLEAPVLCGVGAAFDFHAGRISQAPSWMQERGLEWIYRIAQEPRRLLPRYLSYNPAFVLAFARQLFRERGPFRSSGARAR